MSPYRYIPVEIRNRMDTRFAVDWLLGDKRFTHGDREQLAAAERIAQEINDSAREQRHYLRLTAEDHERLDAVAAKPGGHRTGEMYGFLDGEDDAGKPMQLPAGPHLFPHLRLIQFAKDEIPPKPEEPKADAEKDEDIDTSPTAKEEQAVDTKAAE